MYRGKNVTLHLIGERKLPLVVLPYQSMVTSYILILTLTMATIPKAVLYYNPLSVWASAGKDATIESLFTVQCLTALSANSSTWTVSFLHVLVQQLRTWRNSEEKGYGPDELELKVVDLSMSSVTPVDHQEPMFIY